MCVRRAGGPATSQSCASEGRRPGYVAKLFVGGPAARLRRKVVRQDGRRPGYVAKLCVRRAGGPATSQSCASEGRRPGYVAKLFVGGPAARLRRKVVRQGAGGPATSQSCLSGEGGPATSRSCSLGSLRKACRPGSGKPSGGLLRAGGASGEPAGAPGQSLAYSAPPPSCIQHISSTGLAQSLKSAKVQNAGPNTQKW